MKAHGNGIQKGTAHVACEEYRNGLMALLDGELPESERVCVEHHLLTCPHCTAEYERFEQLALLTTFLPPSPPSQFSWNTYYRGVCRKMESRASWASWSFLALLLVTTGTLMLATSTGHLLVASVGFAALACGAVVMWLSYFCNCESKPAPDRR